MVWKRRTIDDLEARVGGLRVQIHCCVRTDEAAEVVRQRRDIDQLLFALLIFLEIIAVVKERRPYFSHSNNYLFNTKVARKINNTYCRLKSKDLLFHLENKKIFHGHYSEEGRLLKLLCESYTVTDQDRFFHSLWV